MAREFDVDRRAYLKTVGAGGLALGIAGCMGNGGNGGGGVEVAFTIQTGEQYGLGVREDDSARLEAVNAGLQAVRDDGVYDSLIEEYFGSGEDAGDVTEGADGGTGAGTIVAGTAPGFAPFEFNNDEGQLVGFDVELTEAVVARTDYEFGGFETFEFNSLIPALRDGNIDLIAAAMTITEERDEQINFSNPYYEANQGVLVQSDGDFSPESREDLEGRVVGAQSGTTGEDEVDKLIEDGIIAEDNKRTYDNYELAVNDLESGNIDAVIIDVPVAENFAQR
ncbi:transporter substrate-binding domain-containing protein [Natronomonas marina]|jgi:ABC-type amino acid transport substrate-binding protein|uniref:transporter substrate-binding domain-containing protein n=1 Tax=Natronomonas marina TaxID=2961939 RepID=UPI0020C9FE6F|nr:transporter substrate-binding domain-containing protein [Natronomonas marina]